MNRFCIANQIQDHLLRWLAQEVRYVCLGGCGVGVPMIGKSGIGKSEVALELISKVIDLWLMIRHSQKNVRSFGGSPRANPTSYGDSSLGINNIRHLFGVSSVRDRKRVGGGQLMEWQEVAEFDRLGLQEEYMAITGVKVKHIRLPVCLGALLLSLSRWLRNRLLTVQGISAEFRS